MRLSQGDYFCTVLAAGHGHGATAAGPVVRFLFCSRTFGSQTPKVRRDYASWMLRASLTRPASDRIFIPVAMSW